MFPSKRHDQEYAVHFKTPFHMSYIPNLHNLIIQFGERNNIKCLAWRNPFTCPLLILHLVIGKNVMIGTFQDINYR